MNATNDASLRLTTAEEEEVRQITDVFTQSAKHDQSMETLIHRWKSFTREVEQGYTSGFDDYANDLSVRGLIQRIIDGVASTTARKIEVRVAASDERYRRGTVETTSSISALSTDWWWRRAPQKLTGDLARDFIQRGIS